MRQRTPTPLRYFVAGVEGGAGAAGVAGSGAGAETGGPSRTTDDDRSPPRIASENEVSVKMIAMTAGVFPSTLGVSLEPDTGLLAPPPEGRPESAPLPGLRRPTAVIAEQHRPRQRGR